MIFTIFAFFLYSYISSQNWNDIFWEGPHSILRFLRGTIFLVCHQDRVQEPRNVIESCRNLWIELISDQFYSVSKKRTNPKINYHLLQQISNRTQIIHKAVTFEYISQQEYLHLTCLRKLQQACRPFFNGSSMHGSLMHYVLRRIFHTIHTYDFYRCRNGVSCAGEDPACDWNILHIESIQMVFSQNACFCE